METSHIVYPTSILSQYVKYYWIFRTGNRENKRIQTIPSGCTHLVFHREGNLFFSKGEKQPKNFIRGQLSLPNSLVSSQGIDMIATVFHPLGLTPFFSLPTNNLYNKYIDIDDINDIPLKNLKERISNEPDVSICINQIELFLINRIRYFNDYNYLRILNSIQQIKENIEVKVSDLADNACLGYRQFKREFTKYVGMDPKEYLRVIRFQKILYSLQINPDIHIADLVYICGFYDHSHLIKDFRHMSGCSPSEYLSSRKPYSTFFSKDCRINLIKSTSQK